MNYMEDLKAFSEKRVTFYHLRDQHLDVVKGAGGMTIALRWSNDSMFAQTIEVGLAVCSPNDTFNKKIGRTLALKRLDSAKRFTFQYDPNHAEGAMKQAFAAMVFMSYEGDMKWVECMISKFHD